MKQHDFYNPPSDIINPDLKEWLKASKIRERLMYVQTRYRSGNQMKDIEAEMPNWKEVYNKYISSGEAYMRYWHGKDHPQYSDTWLEVLK
jgi:hypothetical protein